MSIDHDITAHLDTPNLTAVKVVAAVRLITVAEATRGRTGGGVRASVHR